MARCIFSACFRMAAFIPHQQHLYALVRVARDAGIERIFIHAFLDGRDTSPSGGEHYLAALQANLKEIGAGTIATVIGRYFAMDRDNRWERVEQAYKLMFLGEGTYVADPVEAVRNEYTIKKTDEFMPALVCLQTPRPLIAEGDGLLFFNFRGDRARELSQVILDPDFKGISSPISPQSQLPDPDPVRRNLRRAGDVSAAIDEPVAGRGGGRGGQAPVAHGGDGKITRT